MLKIDNLYASINGKSILNGINLEVNEGEVHAIMGPNGSGKSTLASVLAGREEYEVTEGTVSYLDKNLLELSPEIRAREGVFQQWKKMIEPKWPNVTYPEINYQDIIYYSAPKQKVTPKSLDEVDPELRETFTKLGISLEEQKRLTGVAVDAVIDSVSVATTFKDKLNELGIVFSSFSDAVKEHPELVKKYLGSVVPPTDNYFAALNSAVFSDGCIFLGF